MMLKGIESEEEGSRDIKREREGNTDEEKNSETTEEKSSETTEEKSSETTEEKSSETTEEKSSETTEEKSSGQEEEEEEEEESEFEMDGEEEYEESEEEEGEDTCVYSEYEDRSGEPDKLDIDSEDEGDEDIRAYLLQMWKTEDFEAPDVYIKGRYLCVFPTGSPYRDYWWERAQGCAEFAVEHYNKNRAGPDVMLKFSKLTNVTSFGWRFYNVTFEAVNIINDETKVYQAKVERDFYDKFKVEFFRKKRYIFEGAPK